MVALCQLAFRHHREDNPGGKLGPGIILDIIENVFLQAVCRVLIEHRVWNRALDSLRHGYSLVVAGRFRLPTRSTKKLFSLTQRP